MSAVRSSHPAHSTIAAALARLRAHAQPGANLYSDSRAVRAGDVFLAYAVDGVDNRSHIAGALARGAAAVLVQPEGFAIDALDSTVTHAVPDLGALAGEIASGWYGDPSDAMFAVGVTGTNGKTSCTQWIATALSALRTPAR